MKSFLLILGIILCLSAGVYITILGVDKNYHPTKITMNLVKTATVPPHCDVPPTLTTKKVLSVQVPDSQIVVLAGEIGENAYAVIDQIVEVSKNKKPIWLLINSPGGSVIDGALVISAMESAGVPVYTVCMQLCASMAAIIHQHGTKRYVIDRSFLMFHDGAGQFQGYMPHVEAQFQAVDRYINKLNYYIAQRAGISPNDWMTIVHKNLWIDGEDAVNRKLADDLVFVKVVNTKGVVNMNSLVKPQNAPVQKTTPNFLPNNPFKDLTL